jgi:two-component system, OmpR family, phosphate regulon sensor histidine kinase PhoR
MSLALLGLLGLQFYWINNAIKITEDRFKHNIHDVLETVSRRIEHREILCATRENIDRSRQQNKKFAMKIDSNGIARWKEDRVVKRRRTLTSPVLSIGGYEIQVEEEAIVSKTGFAKRNKINGLAELPPLNYEKLNPILDSIDSLEYTQNVQQQSYLKYVNKLDMVAVVLENLVNFDRPVEERLNKKLLDSLLRLELQAKQLDLAFKFGVLDTRNYDILYADDLMTKLHLLQSGFHTRLFPNDEFAPASYLYITFPHQSAYLLRDMLWIFATSVLLIGVVIGCFTVAILTIIKQKETSLITNDFINNMTHEFKTPVSTISLACEVMQDPDMQGNDRQRNRYLNIIKEENSRLGRQIEKVLQIAILDKNDFKLKIETLDLHSVIDKVVQNIAIQIENRQGILETIFNATNSQIEADEVHLTNIIFNLLDNANKYSPQNPDILLTTENLKDGVVLTIADKGLGIAKDTINKIFDRFYRVPTGNIHNVKGFGLGLSYVKSMVDAHNGQISVKSELNKGTTFTIFLPYKHERN